MRTIGYLCLVIGFLWLGFCALSVRPTIRAIGIEHFKKYPPTETYSGTDVCDAIRSALLEYLEFARGVIIPATLMLVGGILLDMAGRRAARRASLRSAGDKPP